MIRFSISITEIEKVKTFLANSDLSYITILASGETVYFMTNTKELYMHYSFRVLSRHNLDTAVLFRLDRKTLSSMILPSILEFNVDDTKVVLRFIKEGGKLLYSYETIRQVDVLGSYLERLDLLEEVENYSKIDLTAINRITRFGKSLGKDISCSKNVASIKMAGGFIFSNIKSEPFVCSAKMLSLLVNYTLTVYNVQNYLIHKSSDIVIMVTKHRQAFTPEIEFLKEQKTLFRVDFEMKDAVDLCRRLRLQECKFTLDVEDKIVLIEHEHSTFKSTLNVLEIKSRKEKQSKESVEIDLQNIDLDLDSDMDNFSVDIDSLSDVNKLGIPKITIPSDLLNRVVVPMGKNTISMLIKANFIIIKIKYVYIVFGRRDD